MEERTQTTGVSVNINRTLEEDKRAVARQGVRRLSLTINILRLPFLTKYHDSGEIDGGNCVEDDENSLVINVLDAVPRAHGKCATESKDESRLTIGSRGKITHKPEKALL